MTEDWDACAERERQGYERRAALARNQRSGTQFLAPQFAGALFGPGQLLDVARYYIIWPDNIGQGKSSKPNDSMHAHFSTV
jgi:homoserine O-acetyltransferase/O-succinyltransferase